MRKKDDILFKDFYRQRVLDGDSRWLICSQCPYKVVELCGVCGCQLAHKVRDIHETCPKGKW